MTTQIVDTNAELAAVTEELIDLQRDWEEMVERHGAELRGLGEEIAEFEGRQAHLLAGTSEEDLRLGRRLVEVKGSFREFDQWVVQEAVEDIAAGCLTLRSEYFCRRVYEGHVHRETYRYGYGPRHGHAVFRIGLAEGALRFFRRWRMVPLGEDRADAAAAIRYLLNLKEAGRP